MLLDYRHETELEEARTMCQSQGGDLAVIETQELWNFVVDKSTVLG